MLYTQDKLAREAARRTGFEYKDVKEVVKALDVALQYQLEQGNTVKWGKLFKVSPYLKPSNPRAYDGIHKRHYVSKEHYVWRFNPLIGLKGSLKKLNSKKG